MVRWLLIACLTAGAGAAAAAECPTPKDNGGRLSFSGKKLAQAHYTQVIAGGRIQLANCGEVPGNGHVTPTPDFNVMIAGIEARALEFRTAGDCDTLLLVASAEGAWHFNDDDGAGRDARVRVDAASDGRYDVWVGTYDRASCRARLIIESFD